ncbi:MAG: hypothetical protein DRQ24_11735 [Candidatus Latescibacterota bacterium]|nr:MAG: hypothetical protein DRQ24_11735 [Candidatus Latescibacterota bacterium]
MTPEQKARNQKRITAYLERQKQAQARSSGNAKVISLQYWAAVKKSEQLERERYMPTDYWFIT